MMIDTKRKRNETYMSYVKRITAMCTNKVITHSEWGDCLLGDKNRYEKENCRKAFYVLEKVLKIDDSDLIENNDEGAYEAMKELEDAIYKQRVQLSDENRIKRSLLREEARFEKLLEVLIEGMSNLPVIEMKEYEGFYEEGDKYAVLSLSDWHCGAIVDNQFNFYNIEVMTERAETLKEKALQYCELHKVTHLVIEVNGDMVDGLIHVSSRVQQEEDTVSQIITVSNVLSTMFNDMKPYFKEIKVYVTVGNHGRMVPSKHDSITKENFEMLIPEFLRLRCPGIKVVDSHGMDFLKYEIDGKVICLSHGQNDKVTSVVSDFSKVYRVIPDECHLGHTHGYKDMNDSDTIVSVNGSLIGGNDYSLTLRKTNSPSQNLIVYEKDRCVYEIKV